MGQIKINDRIVTYDDEAAGLGARHLLTLEFSERECVFRAAKLSGLFKFEDRHGRNFTLRRVSSGVYRVEKRGSDVGGWF